MSEKKHSKSETSSSAKDFVKTVISFNKGGNWEEIKAPLRDASGQIYDCEDACFLNLHGVSGDFPPFYSVPSAVGIIIANGNVGSYLSHEADEVSTFLSRDGGLNWFEVRKGSHIYEIGDHGGLLVMADDQHPTDSILYSWDEGLQWQEQRVSNEKLMVKNIIIEPSSTALHFVLYGETVSKKGKKKGIVIGLNFTSLNSKQCSNPDSPDTPTSDYEKWSPSDGKDSSHQCLLGKKSIIVRRKREVDCYNGQEFDRKITIENCTCTNTDYECDEGFSRPSHKEACSPINADTHKLPAEGDVHRPPDNCKGYFSISRGYRKVPGNKCVDGVKFDPIVIPCPYSGFFSSLGVIFFVLILVVLFCLIFFAFNNTFVDKVKDYVDKNHDDPENRKLKNDVKYIDIGPSDEDNTLFDEEMSSKKDATINKDEDSS